jgi:hypothetical protein
MTTQNLPFKISLNGPVNGSVGLAVALRGLRMMMREEKRIDESLTAEDFHERNQGHRT